MVVWLNSFADRHAFADSHVIKGLRKARPVCIGTGPTQLEALAVFEGRQHPAYNVLLDRSDAHCLILLVSMFTSWLMS